MPPGNCDNEETAPKIGCLSAAIDMDSDLVTAHVLLQCTDPDHENACKDLRDDLMKNFLEVKKASTVQAVGKKAFCVRGIAIINPGKRQKFESALREMNVGHAPGSKVLDVRVYLETR